MANSSPNEPPGWTEFQFGTATPWVAHHPHAIVSASPSTTEAIAREANCSLGFIGHLRPINDSAGPYARSLFDYPEDFALWRMASNQQFLMQYAMGANGNQFGLIVSMDSQSSAVCQILEWMKETSVGEIHFDTCFQKAEQWLNLLGWFAFRLTDEDSLGVIVANGRCEHIIASIARVTNGNRIVRGRLTTNYEFVPLLQC
jgi:hypothetical protein